MDSITRKRWFRIIKVLIFLLSCLFIGYHITSRSSTIYDAHRLLHTFSKAENLFWIGITVILMILNWTLETMKWRLLIRPVEKLGFIKAFRSVLSGTTVSFYTPNRIGEFAGRIVYLQEGHRVRGALASFTGSSAQLLVTLQAGIIGLLYTGYYGFLPDELHSELYAGILIGIVVIISVAWFFIPKLGVVFEKIRWLHKYRRFWEIFSHYHKPDLIAVYLFSLFRYIIFCTQQYLLFKAFGIIADYSLVFFFCSVSFLLITIVPSIALGELGVRGSVNLFVFSLLINDSFIILAATFTLWCINLAIPAMLGALSVLYIRMRE